MLFVTKTKSMKLLYRYCTDENGRVTVNASEAGVVKLIFERYLVGDSFGTIDGVLADSKTISPTGKDIWSHAAIDRTLSSGRYIPYIISLETFIKVQFEKDSRSDIHEDTSQPQTT